MTTPNHGLHQINLVGKASDLLARLDHVTPKDGDDLVTLSVERGWAESIRHFANARMFTPEGAVEAGKILAATNEWVDGQDNDLPTLPPIPIDG